MSTFVSCFEHVKLFIKFSQFKHVLLVLILIVKILIKKEQRLFRMNLNFSRIIYSKKLLHKESKNIKSSKL